MRLLFRTRRFVLGRLRVAKISENQLKELEGNHFALTLVEPSKFQQQDQHMVWQQQVTAIENSIFKLRQHQMKLSIPEEE